VYHHRIQTFLKTKNMRSTIFAIALVTLLSISAAGQTSQLSGTVVLVQPGGVPTLVKGAVIDIYRTDIKHAYRATTDASGHYIVPGIPFIGTYTIGVSAAGAKPAFRAGVRISQQSEQNFTLEPGDGTRLTVDQMSLAGSQQPETADARIKREELERRINQVAEENKKIVEANAIAERTLRAGNEALYAEKYDEAIAQFRAGLAARPDEPTLMTNLAEALRLRGVKLFNAAITNKDAEAKEAATSAAKKDWVDAAKLAHEALENIPSSETDPARKATNEKARSAAMTVYAYAMRLIATKVDQAQLTDAWQAQVDYEAIADPQKRKQIRGDALQMLLDAGSTDRAVSESRKVLLTDPNDPAANRVLGLALFATGDKKAFAQAAYYLGRFVNVAPDTDPLKESAREAFDYLIKVEQVKPRP
jgi:tetratricopeptide (TPR) repeat protein